jgi:hypothetical protein
LGRDGLALLDATLFFALIENKMKNKKHPTIWNLKNLIEHCGKVTVRIDKEWVPCRPIGPTWLSNRIKATWLVFTGKADAVIWSDGQ